MRSVKCMYKYKLSCKYNSNYGSGIYGDFVWVDNINITSAVTYGCTDPSYANYNPATT